MKKITINQIFILLASIIGFIYFFACKHSITSDGMSYLDMARGFANGESGLLINPLWSPLYPILLGSVINIINPSSYWEFSTGNFTTFLSYIFSLCTYTFLLHQVVAYYASFYNSNNTENMKIESWVIYSIGYVLFLQVSINIITLWGISPDILLSAFIYLIFGLILKIYFHNHTRYFICLGIALSLGYLTKAIMLPLSFLFILMVILLNPKKNSIKAIFSLIIFLAISFPYMQSLSTSLGHFSFGESGRINYLWYINNIPLFTHWQGEEALHTTRKIFSNPDIFEFSYPIKGTYPPWFNPVYWYEGAKFKIDISRQIESMMSSIGVFVKIFIHKQIALLFGFLLLFYLSDRVKTVFNGLKENKIFILPSLFVFILFSNVHLEERYIGAFIPIFWIGLLLSLKLINSKNNIQTFKYIIYAMLITLIFNFSSYTIRDIYNWNKNASIHYDWIIAHELNMFGVKQGSPVATIGYEIPESAYWASVLKGRIISEITKKDAKTFWALDSNSRKKVIDVFKSTGAKVIVSKEAPRNCTQEGWKSIPKTKSYFLLIG